MCVCDSSSEGVHGTGCPRVLAWCGEPAREHVRIECMCANMCIKCVSGVRERVDVSGCECVCGTPFQLPFSLRVY